MVPCNWRQPQTTMHTCAQAGTIISLGGEPYHLRGVDADRARQGPVVLEKLPGHRDRGRRECALPCPH